MISSGKSDYDQSGWMVLECVAVTAELRFETPMKAFMTARRFHELVAGEPPDEEPPMFDQRMVFNHAADGIRAVVQPSLIAVIRQGDLQEAADDILKRLVRLQREFQDLNLSRVGVRSAWRKPFGTSSWDPLLDRFRTAFIARGPSYARGDDLGVSFSSHGGEFEYNVSCGPMEREQLNRQFLPFPEKYDSPDLLFFADVDYWVNATSQFNRRRIDRVIHGALGFASGFAEDLLKQFERDV